MLCRRLVHVRCPIDGVAATRGVVAAATKRGLHDSASARIHAAATPVAPSSSLDTRWHALRTALNISGNYDAHCIDAASRSSVCVELHQFFVQAIWTEGIAVHWPALASPSSKASPPIDTTALLFRKQALASVLRAWTAAALRFGVMVDIVTLNRVLMLHAAVSLPSAVLAFNLFPLMGIAPDVTAFTTLLRACVMRGAPAAALPYLIAMRVRGLRPPSDIVEQLATADDGVIFRTTASAAAYEALQSHVRGLQAEELRADLAELRAQRIAVGDAMPTRPAASRSLVAEAVREINAAYGIAVEAEEDGGAGRPGHFPRRWAGDAVDSRDNGRSMYARRGGPTQRSRRRARLLRSMDSSRDGGLQSAEEGEEESLRHFAAAVMEAAAAATASDDSDDSVVRGSHVGDGRRATDGRSEMQRRADEEDDDEDAEEDDDSEDNALDEETYTRLGAQAQSVRLALIQAGTIRPTGTNADATTHDSLLPLLGRRRGAARSARIRLQRRRRASASNALAESVTTVSGTGADDHQFAHTLAGRSAHKSLHAGITDPIALSTPAHGRTKQTAGMTASIGTLPVGGRNENSADAPSFARHTMASSSSMMRGNVVDIGSSSDPRASSVQPRSVADAAALFDDSSAADAALRTSGTSLSAPTACVDDGLTVEGARLPLWLLRAVSIEVTRQVHAAAFVTDMARVATADTTAAVNGVADEHLRRTVAAVTRARLLARLAFAGRHSVYAVNWPGGSQHKATAAAYAHARVVVAAALRKRMAARAETAPSPVPTAAAARASTADAPPVVAAAAAVEEMQSASPPLARVSRTAEHVAHKCHVDDLLGALNDALMHPYCGTDGAEAPNVHGNDDLAASGLLHPRSAGSLRNWANAREDSLAPAACAAPDIELACSAAVGTALSRIYVALSEADGGSGLVGRLW